jgi:DtxR family transcriptional regulator, Mn-dependent transcriptional regulator
MTHENELAQSLQEGLEAVWHRQEGRPLSDGVPSPEIRQALEEKGWLEPGTLKLTEPGKGFAASAIRRHRLAERLLADLLGRPEGSEEHACRLEHSLLEGLDDRVCTFLGHPRVCPHGHPIPEGECCLKDRHSLDGALVAMSSMRPGEEGLIAYLATPDDGDLQKFFAMGLHPGDPIGLVRKSPTVVFRSGHSQFAIDRDLAAQVFVRRK